MKGASGPDTGEWSTDQSCIVCFGDYIAGDLLCRLPCRHVYHAKVRYKAGRPQDVFGSLVGKEISRHPPSRGAGVVESLWRCEGLGDP